MSDNVIVRHRDEGRTVLVGGADYITYKVRSDETDRTFFCFEASSSPGFGVWPDGAAGPELPES